MNTYCKYLKQLGINIDSAKYIDLTAWFDSDNYSFITIGDGTVISREVAILVHDYSIEVGLLASNKKFQDDGYRRISEPVNVGKNCFIGIRSLILPGTHIGDNCIIGAGSVVKGEIEPFSIVAGNPAKKIGDIRTWTDKKIKQYPHIEDLLIE
jgi:acetyltransferase-like isoleucine patch superfamily enzyme